MCLILKLNELHRLLYLEKRKESSQREGFQDIGQHQHSYYQDLGECVYTSDYLAIIFDWYRNCNLTCDIRGNGTNLSVRQNV